MNIRVVGPILLLAGLAFAQQQGYEKGAKGIPVAGETGISQAETPVSTTGSVGRTTPGIDTEAGRAQAPGSSQDVPVTAIAAKPREGGAVPHDILEAGQTAQEADIAAQAASRAEIVPGSTLGVGNTPGANQEAGAKQAKTTRKKSAHPQP